MKGLRVTKNVEEIKFEGFWGELELKKKGSGDCLQNFLLLSMFLLTAKLVKNSHILAKIFFIFLNNVLKQTRNSFNTKFRPQ